MPRSRKKRENKKKKLDNEEYVPSEEEEQQIQQEEEENNDTIEVDMDDTRFILGFQLRHFGIDAIIHETTNDNDGDIIFDDGIDLRKEEKSPEDISLNDNIVAGLINSLLNSSDKVEKKKGKELKKTLNICQAKTKNNNKAIKKNEGSALKKKVKINSKASIFNI